MKVRDYETELLEIEKAYNDEQTLIKQCTEKLFEDMKEPMDFFIRKEFVTGKDCTYLFRVYNFAINEATDFKGDAIIKSLYEYSSFYIKGTDYSNWCFQNKINTNELEVMISEFLNKKYTIKPENSWSKLFHEYEARIFKKDLKKEVSQKLTKEIYIKDLSLSSYLIITILVFFTFVYFIALIVGR